VSTPDERRVRTMIEALKTQEYVSDSLSSVMDRLRRARGVVTARRRELLGDDAWYRSPSFGQLHRPCGFDDHLYSFRAIDSRTASGLALRREVGDRPFGEEEQDLLALFHEQVIRLEPQRAFGDPRLTPRERDVLRRLLDGASEKEVAFELQLSAHTVHSYAKSIYAAYRVSSRAELLVRCLRGPEVVLPVTAASP
jgi:DNA-binding CsgD family transcriptional regulator